MRSAFGTAASRSRLLIARDTHEDGLQWLERSASMSRLDHIQGALSTAGEYRPDVDFDNGQRLSMDMDKETHVAWSRPDPASCPDPSHSTFDETSQTQQRGCHRKGATDRLSSVHFLTPATSRILVHTTPIPKTPTNHRKHALDLLPVPLGMVQRDRLDLVQPLQPQHQGLHRVLRLCQMPAPRGACLAEGREAR